LLRDLLARGTPLLCAWSAGKDSTATLNVLLSTAAELRAGGQPLAPIIITHADTDVENPEVWAHARREMDKIRAFGERHGLDVRVEVSHPPLSAQWAVRVIGGSALPIFPNAKGRDCTVDLKIKPQQRLRRRLLPELEAGGVRPVTVVATRFEESASRAERMNKRGDTAHAVRADDDGNLYLTPIADWAASDVWEYLGLARAGQVLAYSDFDDTFRLYADAAGTSCAVVGDDMTRTLQNSRGCGARFGCHQCQAVGTDASLANMVETDPNYHYMRGLNRLQQFIAATQYDWTRRNWIGRTIDAAGYVTIQPDLYHPRMLDSLLRYALTIDVEEQNAAAQAGLEAPRFQLIGLKSLIAIDAEWSRQGVARPFHALSIYRDIIERGARYPVPAVEPIARTSLPAPRYLYVGPDWDEDAQWAYTGLRDPLLEAQASDGLSAGCAGSTTSLRDGTSVLALDSAEFYDIDEEGASLLLAFELDRLIETYHDDPGYRTTAGYHYYASSGLLTLAKGQARAVDTILRRTAYKERHGLTGDYDLKALLARTISAEEHRARTGLHTTDTDEPQLPLFAALSPA